MKSVQQYEGVGSFLHRHVHELEDRLLVRVEVNEIGKPELFWNCNAF